MSETSDLNDRIAFLETQLAELRASAEDGISAEQVVDLMVAELSRLQVIATGDITGQASWPNVYVSNRLPLSLPLAPFAEEDTGGDHPWKATATGTDAITVAEGSILCPIAKGTSGNDMAPIVYQNADYAGGTVTITGDGYLYTTSTWDGYEVSNIAQSDPGDAIGLFVRRFPSASVIFSTDAPGSFDPGDVSVCYPIAQVALTGGVASVVKQILTHNPTHDLPYFLPAD